MMQIEPTINEVIWCSVALLVSFTSITFMAGYDKSCRESDLISGLVITSIALFVIALFIWEALLSIAAIYFFFLIIFSLGDKFRGY